MRLFLMVILTAGGIAGVHSFHNSVEVPPPPKIEPLAEITRREIELIRGLIWWDPRPSRHHRNRPLFAVN